jgi:hypothetical protein
LNLENVITLVGSFYVFAIWIGFEVYSLYEELTKYLAPKFAAPLIITATLAAPVLMASQNWDDHDRSGNIQH